MDTKTATEIWDYLEDNKEKNILDVADELKITVSLAESYCATYSTRCRGEFILLLTKEDEKKQTEGSNP